MNISEAQPFVWQRLSKIKSNDKRIYAKEIYDSRPDNIDASMYQVFLGYYINPISSNDKIMPKLMDFTQDKEFSFYYVIPFEDNSCLVEYTFFTPTIHTSDELKNTLDSYIQDTLGQYNLIRSEYGLSLIHI